MTARVAHKSHTIGPHTARKRRKADTRARVMEAARELFAEHGYETTSIKQIAAQAKVAVGSVFTHFENKAELLRAISFQHLADHAAALIAAPPRDGDHLDRIEAFFHLSCDYELSNLDLVAALRSQSWAWSADTERQHRALLAPAMETLAGIVRDAQRNGHARDDLDVTLFCETLMACHLINLRRALFEGADVAALRRRIRLQAELLFTGARD